MNSYKVKNHLDSTWDLHQCSSLLHSLSFTQSVWCPVIELNSNFISAGLIFGDRVGSGKGNKDFKKPLIAAGLETQHPVSMKHCKWNLSSVLLCFFHPWLCSIFPFLQLMFSSVRTNKSILELSLQLCLSPLLEVCSHWMTPTETPEVSILSHFRYHSL